jgi:serine/threonine-protein kinase
MRDAAPVAPEVALHATQATPATRSAAPGVVPAPAHGALQSAALAQATPAAARSPVQRERSSVPGPATAAPGDDVSLVRGHARFDRASRRAPDLQSAPRTVQVGTASAAAAVDAPAEPPAHAGLPPRGRLRLDATPYALVSLEGKRLGITPIDVELPAAAHTLTLRNPERGIETTYRVEVIAGESLLRRVELE